MILSWGDKLSVIRIEGTHILWSQSDNLLMMGLVTMVIVPGGPPWSPQVHQINDNESNCCARFVVWEKYNILEIRLNSWDAQFVLCCININAAKGKHFTTCISLRPKSFLTIFKNYSLVVSFHSGTKYFFHQLWLTSTYSECRASSL